MSKNPQDILNILSRHFEETDVKGSRMHGSCLVCSLRDLEGKTLWSRVRILVKPRTGSCQKEASVNFLENASYNMYNKTVS